MIPAGTYRGRCTGVRDVRFGRTTSGGQQIGLLFEITDGEYRGTRVPWYGSLTTPASIQLVRSVLMTCGWDRQSWTALRGIDRRTVMLVVEEERDPKGVIRSRLKYINNDTTVVMRDELSPDEVQTLLAGLDEGEKRAHTDGAAGVQGDSADQAHGDIGF
jgi:hypothetical protein